MGPQLLGWLEEPGVVEIMLNPDATLWVERQAQGTRHEGSMERSRAETFINVVAACLGRTITARDPVLECTLPFNGSRFEATIPPIVEGPSFTIRRPAEKIYTLDQYVEQGILSPQARRVLRAAVVEHKNILVAGGTGSGKTTLVNAIIHEIDKETPDDRPVIIQDINELQCQARNKVELFTSDEVDMTRLLRVTMRYRPDRIIVGEVRGPEALALLKAWNTGHPGGVATVHANDCPSALVRIEQLILEGSASPASKTIGDAVDIIVNIARTPNGRVVREIVSVKGYGADGYQLEELKV